MKAELASDTGDAAAYSLPSSDVMGECKLVDLGELKVKPWLGVSGDDLNEILLPKGFVTQEERQCYFYLARNYISGEGHIIDGGACLGSSAYCFAAGLARNPSRGISKVHSYDQFVVTESYVGDMIGAYFRPDRQEWFDDFFDIFEYQTGKYRNFIAPHRGDFLKERWDRSPIELLFIDIAKSKELHDHSVSQFYPYLIPGKSLLLHQDFYFAWLPYIHIGMQYLSHRFEIVDHFIPSASRLYLLKDAISSHELEHVQGLGREERLDLLDAFIDGETGDQKAMARVVKMVQLWYDKDQLGYDTEKSRLISEFGLQPGTHWTTHLESLDKMPIEA